MIQPLHLGHAPAIYAYLRDEAESPDIFFERPTSVEDTEDWIDQLLRWGTQAWVVLVDEQVLGVVTLKPVAGGHQIGFYFRVSARGRGVFRYVREIVLHCPFVERIIATPYPENVACHKFLTKVGFWFHQACESYHEYIFEKKMLVM